MKEPKGGLGSLEERISLRKMIKGGEAGKGRRGEGRSYKGNEEKEK